ncbi:unnamed protein product [Lathyrus sativus]|nr:unnamed protein product [Lathyrus sativus]
MIILSFNVRGLWGNIKNRKVRELVRDFYLDFIVIQEVQLSQVRSHCIIFYWGVLSATGSFVHIRVLVGACFLFGEM